MTQQQAIGLQLHHLAEHYDINGRAAEYSAVIKAMQVVANGLEATDPTFDKAQFFSLCSVNGELASIQHSL